MAFFKKTLILFSCALFLWIGGYGLFVASILRMRPERPDATTNAIVVLTGGQMRIETGLDLFSKGRADHLFITGVHPNVHKSDIKHKWNGDTALPPCCITLGHEAETTIENALETKAWLADKDYTSIRLVTTDFHMPRAYLEFHRLLPDIEFITHPIVQPALTPSNLRFWQLSFIEYHKNIFRRLVFLFLSPESRAL